MHGLPGGLDKLSTIFKLGLEAKSAGKAFIDLFCVPNKDGGYNHRRSHPKEWADFLAYAGQDVTAMRAVYKKCPKWNATPRMWKVWHLDQTMNARGVAVDLKLCEGAVKATTIAKKQMADRVEDMTLGVVERATQRDRLLAYMADYGVDLPDLTADTVGRRLEDESLPEHVKELLRIRQQASKASTAKYQRVLTQQVGGRLHNLLVFCGAARTGRWAGRTFQPQNLYRGKIKGAELDVCIEALRLDCIELVTDNVMEAAASAMRGVIVAAEGHQLVVADLANIEGRFMAWVAGETWKVRAFEAFDAKRGPDLYKVAYARAFNIDPNAIADEGDWRRQIGKVMELALQYYGGVGAFCSMAETYHLDLDAMAAAAWPVIPAATKREADGLYAKAEKRRRLYGLEKRVWLVCQSLVLLWRAAHPAIVNFWSELDTAVKGATRVENKTWNVGRIAIDRRGNWLRVRLPSGRYLCYPAPRVDVETGKSSFIGVDPYTRQWGRIATYSGKIAENIVQAGSADILMDGLLAAEAAGLNCVLSVHDEVMCETDTGMDDKYLSELMITSSPWAVGLPLSAKGFVTERYRK
jgi:DNA polymerase